MGRIIQQNNGKTTIYVTGEDFNTLSGTTDTFYVGVNPDSGNFEKKNPDGSTDNFSGGSSNYSSVSYLEFYNLIYDGLLNPGAYYLINDFQTCYDQPDYDYNGNPITSENYKQGPIDPLLVLATSGNTISQDAYQPKYPKDKIKYDWSWNETEITGNDAKGRITERIDEYNNRTDYDHRVIKFKRYRSYSLNNELSGYIQEVGNQYAIGFETSFENQLTVGDIIYIPTESDQGKPFYKVTAINSNTSLEIEGHNYYGFNSSPNPGIRAWRCELSKQNVDGEASNTSLFTKDGTVQDGTDYFDAGSSYFTNCYPGLFVMVADNINIENFTIQGNLGADGGGSVSSYEYNTTVLGNPYKAFVKRTQGTGDPSVNHIIIVNTDGTGLVHDFSNNTDNDYDMVDGLTPNGVTQIHYLLTGLRGGVEVSDSDIESLVNAYLAETNGNDINQILTILNSNYQIITDTLPARNPSVNGTLYYFNDSGENNINDGGNDMYDGGNRLNTNIFSNIPYTHTQMGIYYSFDFMQSNVITNTGYTEMTTFENIEYPINNYIGNYTNLTNWYEEDFLLSNNVFGTINQGYDCFNNHLGDGCRNNTFARDCNNNHVVSEMYRNVFYDDFYQNTIVNNFNNNRSFGGNFHSNEIGEEFKNNIIIDSFYRNDIGNNFSYNFINNDFQNNFIGNNFQNNVICEDFYKNNVLNGFNNNKIYGQSYGNKIGNGFNGNRIYSNFINNHILDYFEGNQLSDDQNISNNSFENNVIGNYFDNNQIGNNFQYNLIGHFFQQNIIDEGFGFGAGSSQKNYIGDYFQSNNVGEYFYNNKVCNYFQSNILGNYFQKNNIESSISGEDFSSATYVYVSDMDKNIFQIQGGTYKLSFYDSSSVLNIVNITD